MVRVRLHWAKAKAKKIKEPSEKIKVEAANIKENLAFAITQYKWALKAIEVVICT